MLPRGRERRNRMNENQRKTRMQQQRRNLSLTFRNEPKSLDVRINKKKTTKTKLKYKKFISEWLNWLLFSLQLTLIFVYTSATVVLHAAWATDATTMWSLCVGRVPSPKFTAVQATP